MRWFFDVWTKNTDLCEILRNFPKNLWIKLQKIHYLSIFFKKLTNLCVHFAPFGRKIQIVGTLWAIFESFWSKFNRKIEFLASFEKVVAKNRAFGNNTIFLQHFFSISGGGTFPVFPLPWRRLWLILIHTIPYLKNNQPGIFFERFFICIYSVIEIFLFAWLIIFNLPKT